MQKILVLMAHPALEKSRLNRRLAEAAEEVEGITFCDLYERYPDYDVDVRREQQQLEEHDLLVLQHPFYWYSVPPLLKQWIDLVLEHGWAYGSDARALVGKRVLSVISTGGRDESYQLGGHNRFTMRELLAPVEQTFVLCGMVYLPPYCVHGALRMPVEEIERFAAGYRRSLEALRDERLDLEAALARPRIDDALDELILPPTEGEG